MFVRVDAGQFRHFVKRLHDLNRRGIPHAMRNTLNAVAYEAQVTWRREMEQRLVIRAKGFTTRSVRVERAKGIDVRTMRSVVGSDANYMGGVEKGTVMHASGKYGKPVPTGFASGEAGARVPKRLPASGNRRANIELSKQGGGKTEAQKRFLAIQLAVKAGKKFALLKTPSGGHGIYKLLVKGVSKKRGKRVRPTLVWDLSRKSITKRPHPTLKPTLERVNRIAPRLMARETKKQIQFALRRLSG